MNFAEIGQGRMAKVITVRRVIQPGIKHTALRTVRRILLAIEPGALRTLKRAGKYQKPGAMRTLNVALHMKKHTALRTVKKDRRNTLSVMLSGMERWNQAAATAALIATSQPRTTTTKIIPSPCTWLPCAGHATNKDTQINCDLRV